MVTTKQKPVADAQKMKRKVMNAHHQKNPSAQQKTAREKEGNRKPQNSKKTMGKGQ